MTSLLDIGPLTEKIKVNGKDVDVCGVTPEGFFYLLAKFPMMRSMFGGGVKNIDMEMLNEVAPDCVAHALAVATTDRSNYKTVKTWKADVEKAAKVAVYLSAHHQMALFQAALRLTFPDGIGPFMKAVVALANSINRVSGSTDLDTTSSKPSRAGFVTESRGMRLGRGAPSRSLAH